MTKKIYKYLMQELWLTARYVYLAIISLTIFSCLILMLGIPVLNNITGAITTLGLAGLPFVLLALTVINDYKNNQGNKAYLLRSIPAPTSKLFGARFLYNLSYYFFTIILLSFLLGFFFLTQYSVGTGMPFHIMFEYFMNIIVQSKILGFVIFILIYSGLSGVIIILFSITIGSEARFKRLGIGGPVLVYFIYYFTSQILTLISMLLIPLSVKIPTDGSELSFEVINKSMLSEFIQYSRGEIDSVQILGIGFIFVMLILLSIMSIWTYRSMKNKLILN